MLRKNKRAATPARQRFNAQVGGYLQSPFAVRFTNGHESEFFVRPSWIGDPIAWDPRSGLINVVLENAARDWLSWSLGLGPSFATSNPDIEMPIIGGLVSEQDIAESHGIDLFDEVANGAEWLPKVARNPIVPAARIREKFGFNEKVLDVVHGSLDDQHCLSTFVVTESALYQFSETGPPAAVRVPLELFKGMSTPADGQMALYFHGVDEIEFGILPRNAVKGKLKDDSSTKQVGVGEIIVLAGTQLHSRKRWNQFGEVVYRALRDVLPTSFFTLKFEGQDADVSVSKTLDGGGTRLIDGVSPETAYRITQDERFQAAAKSALKSLPEPDLASLLSKKNTVADETRLTPSDSPDVFDSKRRLPDVGARLKNVDNLFESGIITKEEHAEHRARILGDI